MSAIEDHETGSGTPGQGEAGVSKKHILMGFVGTTAIGLVLTGWYVTGRVFEMSRSQPAPAAAAEAPDSGVKPFAVAKVPTPTTVKAEATPVKASPLGSTLPTPHAKAPVLQPVAKIQPAPAKVQTPPIVATQATKAPPAPSKVQAAPVTIPTQVAKAQPTPPKVQAPPVKAQAAPVTLPPQVAKIQPAPTKVPPPPAKVQAPPATLSSQAAKVQPPPTKVQPPPAKTQMAPATVPPQVAKVQPTPTKGLPQVAKVQPVHTTQTAPAKVQSAPAKVQALPPTQLAKLPALTPPAAATVSHSAPFPLVKRVWIEPRHGELYLQLAALDRNMSEDYLNLLASRGFHARASDSPKEGLYRILMGPFKTRADLEHQQSVLRSLGLPCFEVYY